MVLLRFIRGRYRLWAGRRMLARIAREKPAISLAAQNRALSLSNPTAYYLDCARFFFQGLPAPYRQHRHYFDGSEGVMRGFGEDAFHTMWFFLLEDLKPRSFLEIGVYRGQIISLAALWSRVTGNPCEVHGISPFTAAGDAVSEYENGLDYYQDTVANFDPFQLPHPQLIRAFSTDPSARERIASRPRDVIYIDGNHDYQVASQDWTACSQAVRPGGLIVLDDAGLTTSYVPPVFATGGHPGPSKVASEIDRSQFREVLQVGHNRVFQKLS